MNDKFADKAAEWDSPQKIAMTQKFVETLKKEIDIDPSWKGFEIGAGTGLVGLQVLPEMNKMVFEDTSEAMLDVLKNKLKGDEKGEIVHGEVFAYTEPDIDFVFSCMAFHHIPDIEAAINHLGQICKKGATLAIGDIRTEDGSFHHFEPIPHKGFNTDELAVIFNKYGFEVEKTFTYHVLERERTPGVIGKYEQFMLIAKKK